MTFEDFFAKKRIDLAALERAEPALFSEFKTHYERMGEKSFDYTKKYWFNKLRLQYHLAPQLKQEKVVIENPLTEQTVTQTLSETTTPPANAGFKPRFKAGVTKPPEPKEETPAPETDKPASQPPSLGFKPKFKAGVTKSAEPATEQKKEPDTEKPEEQKSNDTDKTKPTYKPRFNMQNMKPKGGE
ncbi:MAG TPA: hypothetical protein VHC47_01485 [Mucilaginibacter sp.]|nr:hypothetical protein [Mucilaginibacter sp.]